MYPALVLRNRTPTSMPFGSLFDATAGVVALVQMLQGHAVAVIVKGSPFETLPPGLTTDTCDVPATAMSAAVIAAVSWLELTNVVVRLLPSHRTVAPLAKFEPVTVRVKAGPPATAELGDSEESVGPDPEPALVSKTTSTQ